MIFRIWGRLNWRKTGTLIVWIAATIAGGTETRAESAFLRPVKDGTLIEHPSGGLSNGSGPSLFAGRVGSASDSIRRAVLEFDVTGSIPAGSTVTGAVLWLNLAGTNAGVISVRIHRIQSDWGEGASFASGGGGAASTPGDSTWIHRYYDDVFWTRPGGDFDPVPRAAAPVDQPGRYSWGPTPETAEDVQAWLDHPESNHGWLLQGEEDRPTTVKRFDSREHAEEANRPLLQIEFIPPCVPDPRGPGYWIRQCAEGADPGFTDGILPCANQLLFDLGFPTVDACDAVASDPPRSCEARALRKLSVLALNLCAGRLQASCPTAPDDEACTAGHVEDLLLEISGLIRSGECRRASGCVSILD